MGDLLDQLDAERHEKKKQKNPEQVVNGNERRVIAESDGHGRHCLDAAGRIGNERLAERNV